MTRSRSYLGAFAFLLTGVGTALLGSTLPATLHEWHLSDERGGLLLLAAWGGSTCGALFARGRLEYSTAAGLALSSFGLLALSHHHPRALEFWYLLYGLGLGLTMTAISLVRSREASPLQADLDLNRLNLLWAAGACMCPALALRSLHLLAVDALYLSISSTFAVVAVAICFVSIFARRATVPPKAEASPKLPWAPWRICLFAAASVGLESAIGSWLTTYAGRSTTGVSTAVSANSAFWTGLLLSRAAHSIKAATWLHTSMARNIHIALVGLATALLLLFPGYLALTPASFLCGFGLGPLYPYALSVSLPRYRSSTVFVLAGVGSSVVPWLTGTLSTAAGSLRVGLLVPCATFGALALSAAAMRSTETRMRT